MSAIDPQRQAADPTASAWVAASAGTGKTKVLTDRVLNLLLEGTRPHRILCLTFTKAAAAEMSKRITDQLGLWVTYSDEELISCLSGLLGRAPFQEEVIRARRLFATVLNTPGGMNIQTIHAFCQSLLGRFPLEAGIAPHFSIIDERSSADMIEAAINLVLLSMMDDLTISKAIANLSGIISEGSFQSLLHTVVSDAPLLRRCIADWGGLDSVIRAVYQRLGVSETDTPENILYAACLDSSFDAFALHYAAAILAKGKTRDKLNSDIINQWLLAPESTRPSLFSKYSDLFLHTEKKTNLPIIKNQKKLLTNELDLTHPALSPILLNEAQRVLKVVLACRAARTASATSSLVRTGLSVLIAYERIKTEQACLDFNDLIEAAAKLLEQDGSALWVLYKLDGGIDHLLIDEAQDTSEQQWRVIRALTAEFFSLQGNRTVFAVGDVKQSIFSFQGASPSQFTAQRSLFEQKATAGMLSLHKVDLTVSYRSTAAILASVDAVFACDAVRDGVTLDGHPIHHHVSPRRQDEGGLVEVWPAVIGRDEDPPEPWKPPIERIDGDAPHARLARLLARRVAEMITQQKLLPSKGRPIQFGDIMVLVRRRDALIEEFVRACKDLNVAVSGIDRLILADQIAVMDLIALGKFVVAPEDDLTLATVLRSPLIGMSEEALYRVSYGRTNNLWKALQDHAFKCSEAASGYAYLSDLLVAVDYTPPFEFFSKVLGPLNGRRRLLARLGQESDEPIAEFLDLALQYQRIHPPSLQGFIHWIERGNVAVKRDLELSERNAVRIMTVHGAKGLQAPIVILPDTMQVPTGHGRGKPQSFYWDQSWEDKLLPLWVPPRGGLVPETAALRQRSAKHRLAEYRRLLYVAMTRAEDQLLICGWRRKQQAEGCWYQLIRNGLLAAKDKLDLREVSDPFLASAKRRGEFDGDSIVLRVECPQRSHPAQQAVAVLEMEYAAPPWMTAPAPIEQPYRRPLVPSRSYEFLECRGDQIQKSRFKRGRIIHRLLHALPSIDSKRRLPIINQWLAHIDQGLGLHERQEISEATLSIINNISFVDFFGPESMAEVDIAGQVGGAMIVGRVDRLIVYPNKISIVDYKTDSPSPTDMSAVPSEYIRQMALYREVLRAAHPDRRIECLLLWTDGPRLMQLDDLVLDRFMS